MAELNWQEALSNGIGLLFSVLVVKHYIAKLISAVETVPKDVAAMRVEITIMAARLLAVEGITATLKEHDREIVKIKTLLELNGHVSNRRNEGHS